MLYLTTREGVAGYTRLEYWELRGDWLVPIGYSECRTEDIARREVGRRLERGYTVHEDGANVVSPVSTYNPRQKRTARGLSADSEEAA